MTREIMEVTAELIAARVAESGERSCQVWSGFVGESTVQFPQLDAFRDILDREGRKQGVQLTAHVALTNATTACHPAMHGRLDEFLSTTVFVSLDGPPRANDTLRVHPDGRGTYAEVLEGIGRLRGAGVQPAIEGTLTALFPDVVEVYQHLFGLGVRYVKVKPVRARPDEPHYIGNSLEQICAAYDRLPPRLLELDDSHLLDVLLGITSFADYFGRFLLRVIHRHVLDRRCPAALHDVWADTDGRLYACTALFGAPEACIGSVWDGVDEARVQELYSALHISRREPCKDCWARFVCGGGCMHQSHLTFGDLFRPDPAECALNKHLIELAIWFYAELKEKRPVVLEQLQAMSRAA